ncbi:MAG: hypothetical protein WEC75_03590, partial [Dehalococcoidia bacterium]
MTTTFVASGRPDGVHDLGRFLENLNNPAIAHDVELLDASVRPLYSARDRVRLDAPLLVKRGDIVFANFEGPRAMPAPVRSSLAEAVVLLLAPPFQISGTALFPQESNPQRALRSVVRGFFSLRDAHVFDADGMPLGEGEQIVVNAAAVQMTSATRQRIVVSAPPRSALQPAEEAAREERARE